MRANKIRRNGYEYDVCIECVNARNKIVYANDSWWGILYIYIYIYKKSIYIYIYINIYKYINTWKYRYLQEDQTVLHRPQLDDTVRCLLPHLIRLHTHRNRHTHTQTHTFNIHVRDHTEKKHTQARVKMSVIIQAPSARAEIKGRKKETDNWI